MYGHLPGDAPARQHQFLLLVACCPLPAALCQPPAAPTARCPLPAARLLNAGAEFQPNYQRSQILSLDETVLDDHYSMVAVQWRMTFAKDPATPQDAEFEILYFLYIKDEQPKMVFYISHDDEKETMKEMGLLPE